VRGKFVFNNPSASTQVNDHHPTFVFIGEDTQHPNVRQQFALIAMNAKKKFSKSSIASRFSQKAWLRRRPSRGYATESCADLSGLITRVAN
jgi:hypothetical protein